jgi:hypothetical protein
MAARVSAKVPVQDQALMNASSTALRGVSGIALRQAGHSLRRPVEPPLERLSRKMDTQI